MRRGFDIWRRDEALEFFHICGLLFGVSHLLLEMSTFYNFVTKGEDLFDLNVPRLQTLVKAPPNGYILLADNKSPNGFTAVPPSQIIVLAGQVVSLTTKGDLSSHDGTAIVRVPVGADGYVLTANSATSSGLEWVSAGSTNGDVNPTANSLAKRGAAGDLKVAGLISSGNIVPDTTSLRTVGSSGLRFAAGYFTTAYSSTIDAGSGQLNLLANNATQVTIGSSFCVVNPAVVATTGVIIGAVGTVGSYKLAVDGSGALMIMRYDTGSSSYVEVSRLA